ncbi:MAG TPA: ABC transporter ATP-binding protein [Candidatus Diapherotrites archaeon]|uniref:ABC transporter ATP-binding protein n=1 Tax=Candidatus Iainarchaeum sp. TaxID=3101447 RepID=A0A7J4IX22_9ARCH|nr:ABC transporter ATP-binding protein [Candidatus Diapherotrites archaeon]
MEKSAISVKGLVKNYNGFTALKGISFEVPKGSFFGYLGPNGAGKTTTINAITGLANFDAGSVHVMGFDVIDDYIDARKSIGFSQQDLIFDPVLNVREILLFQAGYYGIEKKDAEPRVAELLKFFGLKESGEKNFRQLSGGMKRKLQIAKALVHDPKVLVLDEPTAGVDVELRHTLWNYLRKLNKEGMTILLTTHYIEEAEKLCDTIGIISRGEIVALEGKEKLVSSIHKPKLRITLKEPLKKAPKNIEKNSIIEREGMLIEVECENAEKELASVLTSLSEEGAQVSGINIVKQKLEDVYLKLTGEGNELDRL